LCSRSAQVYDTLGVSPQEVERFKNNPKAYQTLGIGSRTSTSPISDALAVRVSTYLQRFACD
jgi:hypothetical protein